MRISRCAGVRLDTVLVHGGYWRDRFNLTLQDAVAAHLAARAYLVWDVDYRPSSDPWPATLTDAALAYNHLATGRYADRVDPDRLAVVGHSAGGHLALWLASYSRPPSRQSGRQAPSTVPAPALVVAQAPVAGLVEAARLGLGDGAVQALLDGTPEEVPERYAAADPTALVPTGVPSVLIHSREDDRVPFSQSTDYVAAATAAGDDNRLVVSTGDHFAHLDPASQAVAPMGPPSTG
jgi:acetyl esterase/lipase